MGGGSFPTVFTAALAVPAAATAQELSPRTNEPPRGPGAEPSGASPRSTTLVRPGWELGGQVGGGIGVGVGVRAGYSFGPGFYAGGSFSHFAGPSVATLLGTDNES